MRIGCAVLLALAWPLVVRAPDMIGLDWEYGPGHRKIRIHGLAPHRGHRGGGTLVNVSGTRFVNYGDVKCRFGTFFERVPGTVRAPSLIQCVTPPYPRQQMPLSRAEVRVEVSLNGIDYTSSTSSSTFTFYDASTIGISLIEPAGGPLLGGTRLTVHGRSFEGPASVHARSFTSRQNSDNAELLLRLKQSRSHVSKSAYVRCAWTRANGACAPGIDCRDDCMRAGASCAMKTAGTFVDRNTVLCTAPAAPSLVVNDTGSPYAAEYALTPVSLDLSFDDSTYTDLGARFVYYDPAYLGVSHADPAGGPDAGGTTLMLYGSGFRKLGASMYYATNGTGTHPVAAPSQPPWPPAPPPPGNATAPPWPASNDTNASGWNLWAAGPDATEEGVYCLFKAERRGAQAASPAPAGPAPAAGPAAGPEAGPAPAGGGGTRRGPILTYPTFSDSYYTYRARPPNAFGAWAGEIEAATGDLLPSASKTERMLATIVSPTRLLCRTPHYVGAHGRDGWTSVSVRVVLNGDDAAASASAASFVYYDSRAARVHTIDVWGGPTDGGTWVRIAGRNFADLRRPRGPLPTAAELVPINELSSEVAVPSDLKRRHVHQLRPTGADGAPQLWSPYDGPVDEGGAFVLGCRFGRTGYTEAHLAYETEYKLDEALGIPAAKNYTGAWEAVPALRPDAARPTPVLWCRSPRLAADPGSSFYNYGHAQSVQLGITLNGQDWLQQAVPKSFLYWPRDTFVVANCSLGGVNACRDQMNTSSDTGHFHGYHVISLQPFGGPSAGGTSVTLIGKYFQVLTAGPRVPLCSWGTNGAADAAPRGGPARGVRAGSRAGLFPWQVRATVLNATHAVCVSPPHEALGLTNGSYAEVAVDLTLNGQLADATSSNVSFEYYGPGVLSTRWLYPMAGPKEGGSHVTLYGTGFKTLSQTILPPRPRGLDIEWAAMAGMPLSLATRGLKCIFGDLPMSEAVVLYAIGSERARAAVGSDGNSSDGGELAAAVVCISPRWTSASSYYAPRAQVQDDRCSGSDDRELCELDEPKTVCVRVTLNDDPMQHSDGPCVRFTYYDV